ncbi:hypothetical protein TWF506_006525 [Arthrobotrys conoides]|uniref:WSC domain-containing protein n=1 Tax=Arthrobotrys conoides TaxID=74498 RepID=A0AAN8NGY7_9PEZI
MMFWKAFLAPAALVGLASAIALPPTNGLDPNTHSLNKRTATMWTWFPPLVPETPWKHVGCFSGEVPLTYHVADFCTCHNKATDAVKVMTMEKCFASCKGAGFRYAGLKGANGAKQCWCGSADPTEYKLGGLATCNVPCGDGEGNLAKKYNENQCGGISTYSIWKDTCYKKFDIEKAPLGYESAGCWSGNGGWLLAHFEKSVSGDNLSIDSCVEACSANGYPYAGMRGGWECFCGGRLSPYFVDIHQKNPQHSTMCTKVCTATWKVYATLPKEEWQYCGGDVYYSLYYNRNLAASTTCSDDDDDKPVVKVTQTITIKGTVTPPVATQTYDKDKTTRVTTTVPADATPKPTDETEEPDNNNNNDDDDDGDDEKVTKTVTRTAGGPEPTETAGEGTVLVTTTVPAPKGAKTITVTQTGTQTLTYKSNKKTVYVTVTVPAVQTVTITQTSGSPAPKTPKSNKKTVYIVITVPARQTVTITQTVGDAAQTTPKANKKTIYVIVTVPRRGPNRGVKTVTVTYTKGGRSLTYKPNKSTVYVTTTVPATKPSDDPEDDPEDGENNPGGKGTDEENPDDKKDDGEKPDDKKDDGENPDDKKDDGENPDDKKDDGENPDDKKDDGENPDDEGKPGGKGGDEENPDDKKDDGEKPDDEGKPGGKGGEPGDEGPDLIDSLCFRPMIPSIVLKNTKWKSIKFPLGDVYAPAVSCHNRKDKFDANYHFKLYVGRGTKWPDAVCRTDYSHKPTEIQAACHNACTEQKKSCEASPKVQKLANYIELCKHQLDACKAINTLKLFPKQIQGINDDYCKKRSPPFPKPPKTGGKPQKGEDLSYY